MIVKNIDLYEYFHQEKPAEAVGNLVCWMPERIENVSPERRCPGALILPGGGYGFTSPREAEPVALRFLARGWTTFLLYYSCAPARFPVALREAAMAMRYLRENAQALHTDPEKIAAIGFSAGGHLCGCLGTLFDCPEVADIGDASLLKPNALGLCYPVTVSWGRTHNGTFCNLAGEDAALRERMSLEKQVRPDMPPVFLWHTRNDQLVACRNSILFAAALEEAGVDFAMQIYHRGPHGASCGDETVYSTRQMPQLSRGVSGWTEDMLDFFGECGLTVTD